MNLIKESKEEVIRKCVDILAEKIISISEEKGYVVLGIPGGRSVINVFELLKKKNLPWKKVHIFMVDERLEGESNFNLAKEYFIGFLVRVGLLPKENVHPFVYDKEKEDFGIKDYEIELREYENFDIVLLSSGEDGHVASLFPNHESIKDYSDYFILVNDAPKMPSKRISASRKLIARSKVALLLFIDEIKRDAFNKFLDENVKVEDCPAKLVLEVNESYVFTNLR